MAQYFCNETFFNQRLFYGQEVYPLEPSEVARITASRQMHHFRLLQADAAPEPPKTVDPLDELAARLVALPIEQRQLLAEKCEKLQGREQKHEEGEEGGSQPAGEDQTQGTGQPPATGEGGAATTVPSATDPVGKPMSRAELVELATKKGIKTDGLNKAQIIEKLAQAAPPA